MKKIITAAAIAAMAAGFATADAKFSFYYRSAFDLAQHEINDNLGDSHGTSFLSNESGARSTEGALTFSGSSDLGGVQLEVATGEKANSSYLTLTKYNGWLNWGNFMIKSGKWDSLAVGRVNASAGNHESKYFGELYKPGLAIKGATGGNGVNISQQSNKNQATMIQYKNNDLGIEARFGWWDTDGVATTFASKSKSTSTTYTGDSSKKKYNPGTASDVREYDYETGDYVFNNSLWFGELGYTIKDVGRIMATTKISHNDYAFGGFFEPKLANVKALTSLIGFTYEYADRVYNTSTTNSDDYDAKTYAGSYTTITNKEARDDKNKPLTAHTAAVDFRARYDLADMGVPLAITFMYNWTFGNTVTDGTGRQPGWYASWGMLNFKYTYNEKIAPFFSAIYTTGGTWSHATDASKNTLAYYSPAPSALRFDDPYNFSLRLYGGVELGPKNAQLITGVVYDASNMMERKVSYSAADGNNADGLHAAGVKAVHIPVYMKVVF